MDCAFAAILTCCMSAGGVCFTRGAVTHSVSYRTCVTLPVGMEEPWILSAHPAKYRSVFIVP